MNNNKRTRVLSCIAVIAVLGVGAVSAVSLSPKESLTTFGESQTWGITFSAEKNAFKSEEFGADSDLGNEFRFLSSNLISADGLWAKSDGSASFRNETIIHQIKSIVIDAPGYEGDILFHWGWDTFDEREGYGKQGVAFDFVEDYPNYFSVEVNGPIEIKSARLDFICSSDDSDRKNSYDFLPTLGRLYRGENENGDPITIRFSGDAKSCVVTSAGFDGRCFFSKVGDDIRIKDKEGVANLLLKSDSNTSDIKVSGLVNKVAVGGSNPATLSRSFFSSDLCSDKYSLTWEKDSIGCSIGWDLSNGLYVDNSEKSKSYGYLDAGNGEVYKLTKFNDGFKYRDSDKMSLDLDEYRLGKMADKDTWKFDSASSGIEYFTANRNLEQDLSLTSFLVTASNLPPAWQNYSKVVIGVDDKTGSLVSADVYGTYSSTASYFTPTKLKVDVTKGFDITPERVDSFKTGEQAGDGTSEEFPAA